MTHNRSTFLLLLISGLVLIALSVLVSPYRSLIRLRVAPGLRVSLISVGTDPAGRQLTRNQFSHIVWDTRPDNIALYPGEHFSLCPPPQTTSNKDCVVLKNYATNTGTATVFVPPDVEARTWNLIMTAWDQSGLLRPEVATTLAVTVADQAAPVASPTPEQFTIRGNVEQRGTETIVAQLTTLPTDRLRELLGKIVEGPVSVVGTAAIPTASPQSSPTPSSLASPTSVSTPTLTSSFVPLSPLASPTPQLTITTPNAAAGTPVGFSLSNLNRADVTCLTAAVNGQIVPQNSSIPNCS